MSPFIARCLGWLAALWLSVAAVAFAADREVDWHDRDAYAGWVTDAATGEPLEGVVVVAVWQLRRSFDLFGAEDGRERDNIRLEERFTDKNGYFEFQPLGDYSPPPGWGRDEIAFPLVRFFKPGYSPGARTRFTWEFGDRELDGSDVLITPSRKDGWKREIRLFRYLTRPFRTFVIDPSVKRTTEQQILEPLIGFASFLDWNVRVVEGHANAEALAIKAQWNAIRMIDKEIRKYRPGYEWVTTSALRQVLQAARKQEE